MVVIFTLFLLLHHSKSGLVNPNQLIQSLFREFEQELGAKCVTLVALTDSVPSLIFPSSRLAIFTYQGSDGNLGVQLKR